jgi:hypothetical protein
MQPAESTSVEAPFTLASGLTGVVRPLSEVEETAARASAGEFPMWGHWASQRFEKIVATFAADSLALREAMRPSAEENRARAAEWMRTEDPKADQARRDYRKWTMNVLARRVAIGLVRVDGWDPLPASPDEVQAMIEDLPGYGPIEFVAQAGMVINEVTNATAGKGPARRSRSTSAPAAPSPLGASLVKAAPKN